MRTRNARRSWRRLFRNLGNHVQTGGLCCDCCCETSAAGDPPFKAAEIVFEIHSVAVALLALNRKQIMH